MGVLWRDGLKTSAIASFENGIVYKGDGIFREQIGTYTSDVVCDSFGNIVAKFNGNTAYSPLFLSIDGYCTYDCNSIYKGGSTWNDTIATYDGDPYGACAAAILCFGLHLNGEQIENEDHSLSFNSENNDYEINSGITTEFISYGKYIGCAVIFIIIYVIAAFAFYFTEWGINMVFGEEGGRQVFFICLTLAIVSGIIMYRSKSINSLSKIVFCVLCLNFVTYPIVLLINFIYEAIQGRLSLGSVIILFIGGAIGTIGVSSMIYLIEILVVFFAKSRKNKTK